MGANFPSSRPGLGMEEEREIDGHRGSLCRRRINDIDGLFCQCSWLAGVHVFNERTKPVLFSRRADSRRGPRQYNAQTDLFRLHTLLKDGGQRYGDGCEACDLSLAR